MANVEHSTLTTTNLHENKGVSTATDNTVATAVSGATVWAKLTASNLTGTGNPFGGQLFHLRDTTTMNLTANTWTKRKLGTTVTNEISGASVASDVISLPAGTYYAEAFAMVRNESINVKTQLRLRNTSDNNTPVVGTTHYTTYSGSGITVNVMVPQTLHGRFTISGTKNIELQNWMNSGVSGSAGTSAGSSEGDVYTDLMIWKVA